MIHFLDLARGRAKNPSTAADALAALRIAVAAEQSLAEGRSVPVG
jgi:predicted dehydrogenase